MISFDYSGEAKTHQRIVPGNTATAIGQEFKVYTEREVAFTSGGTTEVVAGAWIIGATSSAKAEVISVNLISGTWAGGDAAGTLILKNQHGTFQSENLNQEASSNVATIATNSHVRQEGYPYKNKEAQAALITVLANTALCLWDGGTPGQTSLAGQPLPANSSLTLKDPNAIKNFKVIDYTASSASIVNITLYF